MGGLERRPLVSWSVSVVVEDGMRVDVGGKAGRRVPGGGSGVVGWLCLRHLRKEGDEFSAWMTWYCRQAGLVKNIWMNRQRLLNNRKCLLNNRQRPLNNRRCLMKTWKRPLINRQWPLNNRLRLLTN